MKPARVVTAVRDAKGIVHGACWGERAVNLDRMGMSSLQAHEAWAIDAYPIGFVHDDRNAVGAIGAQKVTQRFDAFGLIESRREPAIEYAYAPEREADDPIEGRFVVAQPDERLLLTQFVAACGI